MLRAQLGLLSLSIRSKKSTSSEPHSGHRLPSQDDLESGQVGPSRPKQVVTNSDRSRSLSLDEYAMSDSKSLETVVVKEQG